MPSALEKARQIKMVIFDVDGVLTDGRLFIGDDGQEYKAFNSKDGHGMRMLQDSGTDQIMLSHDYVMHWLGRPLPVLEPIQQLLPNWHLSGIFKYHIPELKKNGISDAQIEAMLVENPRRLFIGE